MQSFYKNTREQMLALAVDKLYNDEIGGNENSMMDGNEYYAWKEDELVDSIYHEVMSKPYLELGDSWDLLEAKHIHFIGKKRVREIVDHRIKYRHAKEGSWLWEKEDGKDVAGC